MEKQLGSKVVQLRVVKVYGIVCHVQFGGHGLQNIRRSDLEIE